MTFARWVVIVVAGFAISSIAYPETGRAQATAKFSFEATANCYRPYVRDFPIRGEGTGTLSADSTARLDMTSNVEGRVSYQGKLGSKIDVPNGTASLRVLGRHTLRATRDYPNNVIIIDVTAIGKKCSVKVVSKLKPGKREYTFQTALGLALCEQPVLLKTTCTAE